jgi:plasmid stabilization system protein ParE
MKRRYELTEDADADINALWLYIAQNRSPNTADRLADRLYDAFELLAENPFLGHQREELTDRPVRFWIVGRYTIAYRPIPPPPRIIAILHGARDLAPILDNRE